MAAPSMIDELGDMLLDYMEAHQRRPNKFVMTSPDMARWKSELGLMRLDDTVLGMVIVEAPKASFSYVTFDARLT